MTVIRKQICLTKELSEMLEGYSESSGLKQTEIIRQALRIFFNTKVGEQKNANQDRKKNKEKKK